MRISGDNSSPIDTRQAILPTLGMKSKECKKPEKRIEKLELGVRCQEPKAGRQMKGKP